jgi:N-methylhydantoinase A
MRVGVEIGGTFTDLVSVGPNGVNVTKVPSVPIRPDEGAFAALAAAGIELEATTDFVHGSTVATNAVLERKGGKLAFLVTEGFRDILLIQRHDRTRIFDLFYQKPVPLVARQDSFEIPERVLSDGTVERAFDGDALTPSLTQFLERGEYDAVAICLLNAFANPAHETAVAALVKRLAPHIEVTISYDVTREFREYERASTTTIAAYVQPVISAYLGRIEAKLAAQNFKGHFSIMQSNGGRIPAAAMRRSAVTALLSGPAAGVVGALRHVGLSGFSDIITLDIGGTSADVCLVTDGKPQLLRESKIGGLPVQMPMVDIATIGAGGGSIVWMDDGGMLRVGPHSSGAHPGPACYGRGGNLPTLTDAHVICGRLRPDALLAGSMSLDAAASERVFAPLAHKLGMSVEVLAESAIRIATANVVSAIRVVSTERGRDPRGYALVPFGGAGPLHAADVADALELDTVVVPPNAGVISAYGLLAADYSINESQTRRTLIDHNAADVVRETVRALMKELHGRADALELSGTRLFDITLDMRFVGQAFELVVPLDPAKIEAVTTESLLAAFMAEHHKIYRHGAGSRTQVEIVSYRAGLQVAQKDIPALVTGALPDRSKRTGAVFEQGRRIDATVLPRSAFSDGNAVNGPAVIEDYTTTIWMPAGWRAEADGHDNLVMRKLP